MLVARADRSNQYVWAAYVLAVCGSAILVYVTLSQYGHSPLKTVLATILMGVCLSPTVRYFANGEAGLPAMPVLCLAYAIQFAIPVFTREPTILLARAHTARLDEGEVVTALLLSILGMCALLAGYHGFQATGLAKGLRAVILQLDEKKAVAYCIAIGLLVPFLARPENFLSESLLVQLSALVRVLQNQALVAVAILGGLIYSDRSRMWYRVLLYWVIGVTALQGLSSGMLEQAIAPMAALFIVQWQMTKRLPLASIMAAVLLIVFLSPVKHEYRRLTWNEDTVEANSTVDKALLWVGQASEYWTGTISGQQSLADSTEQAASRTDLIHQFALVCSLTPSEVPYQYGATYSYFLVAFIPRALWPDKPEAGSANKFFGVSYGLTTEEGAEKSTFGASLMAESYINFGSIGVMLIMALQGVILGLLQRTFGEQRSGIGAQAVYVSFFVFFLNGVGSSAEILFGNLIQSLFLGYALLWWMRAKTFAPRSAETHLALPVARK